MIQIKAITKINVVLLEYFEDRGQQKRFFMNRSCFIFKKKEVLPVSIYLGTVRSSRFSLKSAFYTCPRGSQYVIFVKLFSFFVQRCTVSDFSCHWKSCHLKTFKNGYVYSNTQLNCPLVNHSLLFGIYVVPCYFT